MLFRVAFGRRVNRDQRAEGAREDPAERRRSAAFCLRRIDSNVVCEADRSFVPTCVPSNDAMDKTTDPFLRFARSPRTVLFRRISYGRMIHFVQRDRRSMSTGHGRAFDSAYFIYFYLFFICTHLFPFICFLKYRLRERRNGFRN